MANKIIISTLCLLFGMQYAAYSQNNHTVQNPSTSNSTSTSKEIKDPTVVYVDSAVIGILDGKVISTQTYTRICNVEHKAKVVQFLYPKEAIFKYGEQARGGACICETIKNK